MCAHGMTLARGDDRFNEEVRPLVPFFTPFYAFIHGVMSNFIIRKYSTFRTLKSVFHKRQTVEWYGISLAVLSCSIPSEHFSNIYRV